MNSILFIISVIIPALAGFAVLSIAEQRKDAFVSMERLALSFPLGAGIVSFYLFGIALLGFGITLASTIPIFILGAYGIWMLIRSLALYKNATAVHHNKEPWSNETPWKKLLIFVFIILIGWKLSFILFGALTTPPIFWDALTCWNYKAKVIYFTGLIDLDPGSESFLGGGDPQYHNYPLAPSLFRVWTALVMGGWHENYIQMHSFILLACLLLLVFNCLQEYTSLFVSVLSCYILVSIPLVSVHASSGYVDIIISYYITGSFILLMKWFFAKKDSILIVSAAFMAIAVFTKNEGLVLYLPSSLVVFFYYLHRTPMEFEKKVKSIILYGATVSILTAPWIVFKLINNIPLW